RLERTAYDWLDKVLLVLNERSIQAIQASGRHRYTLEKKAGEWHVTGSPGPDFSAEEPAVTAFLQPWTLLRAERIETQAGKIDWAKFGLAKPYLSLTVSL